MMNRSRSISGRTRPIAHRWRLSSTVSSAHRSTQYELGSALKTLIVDDEPIARQILREELDAMDAVTIVGEAENGEEALKQITKLRPDLVLLDLEMPVMGGFDVVNRLRGGAHLPVVVIVTAYDRHAIQAFEAGAIDYLLKPVQSVRLRKAVERARSLQGNARVLAEDVVRLSEVMERPAQPKARKVVGRHGEEYFLLDMSEILAFQAEGELVWIVTSKQRYLATQSLRALEARLSELHFQRVHRNAIVNINHVRKMSPLSSQRWLLTLSNSQELIVSKRQAHNVRQLLQW